MSGAMATEAVLPYGSFAVLERSSHGLIQIVHAACRNGDLIAQEFREEDEDGRRMSPVKPVGWEEKVPEGARPFAAAGGYKSDFFKMYWLGWIEDRGLSAVALTQENPIPVALPSGDRLVHPAVMGWDRKLKQYLVRGTGAGFAIFRHEFSGEMGEPPKVVTEKVLDLPYEPRFTVAHPAPIRFDLDAGFEDLGEAVIGWLSLRGGDLRAHVLWIRGKELALEESDPVAGYQPYPNQRADLWADCDGTVRFGWLMSRADQDAVRSAEWILDLGEGTRSLLIREASVEGAKMHTAATVLNRISEPGSGTVFILTRTGNLFKDYRGRQRKRIRENVPLAYEFPIFASAAQTYEAVMDETGQVAFISP